MREEDLDGSADFEKACQTEQELHILKRMHFDLSQLYDPSYLTNGPDVNQLYFKVKNFITLKLIDNEFSL